MLMENRQQIIAGILQSPQFQLMLQEEVHRARLREQSQLNYENCVQSQKLVEDIEETLGSVLDLGLRRSINEQFESLLDESSRFRKEFEQLKQRVLRLSIRVSHEELPDFKPRGSRAAHWSPVKRSVTENSFEEDFDNDNMFVEMRDCREPVSLRRMHRELEAVKDTLARISNNSLLQVVEQNNSHLHRKIEDNYLKLSDVIQKNMERNSEIELQKSLHSLVDTHYESMESKIDSLTVAQKELLERQRNFESSIICKHEVSLKSVWNVITKIQNDMDSGDDHNSPPTRKTDSTIKPSNSHMHTSSSKKSISSILSWK